MDRHQLYTGHFRFEDLQIILLFIAPQVLPYKIQKQGQADSVLVRSLG
ncbi:hypothetical protein ES703_63400 [subsurface metagenome]